ncbi:STAS domain-containing protein [Oscillochloris sp. ZM17-4]|uniref:STAS domain-containing protein n=1 Tax=Oscillochloris sp. ZM17-4 TaxID=2866714 RepID=UPI001C7373A7|nr:STAS domain-containing protein [Oscillochloris sp. ZM17-4]MBX0326755.1 STAS domain-containing protein [Oscillochloris sp. ZM17-4]
MSDIIRREEFGEVAILHITSTSVDAISAAAIAAENEQMRPITVLDFNEVSFINSGGISALLKFVVSARKSGYQLFAMNVSPHHQKIFKMVEMSRFMPTIDERDLAEYR